MNIPSEIIDKIKRDAEEDWPDDKQMQSDTVKEEICAYENFTKIDFSKISETEKQFIFIAAKEIYPTWDEITSSVGEEIEALVSLKVYSSSIVTVEELQVLKVEAKSQNENSFCDQLEHIEHKIGRIETARKTRKEIDPLKDLLIQLENIVGNECYNGNIQNYSSWGELDSEGRSFRYPVNFLKEASKYKRKHISKDIPSEELITGFYAFGANELSIYRALHKVVKYLENNYGLKLPTA